MAPAFLLMVHRQSLGLGWLVVVVVARLDLSLVEEAMVRLVTDNTDWPRVGTQLRVSPGREKCWENNEGRVFRG